MLRFLSVLGELVLGELDPGQLVLGEQGDDLVEDGELSRFYWTLAPGDPQGDYELDVAVVGKAVAHFTFRVPAPVHEKAILVHAELPPAERRRGSP